MPFSRSLSLGAAMVSAVLASLLLVSACGGSPATSPPLSAETVAPPAEPVHSVLYYFHRTIRCTECLSMELFAGMLAHNEFVDVLEYRVVNLDDPGNARYAEDFNLLYSTLVLVDEDTTENVARWKDLEEAWEKSQDQEAFTKYVSDAITTWLGSGD